MHDYIQKGFQIEVYDPVVALAKVRLPLPHGLMGRALRAESIALGVEVRFPLRGDDLRDGLLDEVIQHRGNAQGAGFPVRFRDLHTLDG